MAAPSCSAPTGPLSQTAMGVSSVLPTSGGYRHSRCQTVSQPRSSSASTTTNKKKTKLQQQHSFHQLNYRSQQQQQRYQQHHQHQQRRHWPQHCHRKRNVPPSTTPPHHYASTAARLNYYTSRSSAGSRPTHCIPCLVAIRGGGGQCEHKQIHSRSLRNSRHTTCNDTARTLSRSHSYHWARNRNPGVRITNTSNDAPISISCQHSDKKQRIRASTGNRHVALTYPGRIYKNPLSRCTTPPPGPLPPNALLNHTLLSPTPRYCNNLSLTTSLLPCRQPDSDGVQPASPVYSERHQVPQGMGVDMVDSSHRLLSWLQEQGHVSAMQDKLLADMGFHELGYGSLMCSNNTLDSPPYLPKSVDCSADAALDDDIDLAFDDLDLIDSVGSGSLYSDIREPSSSMPLSAASVWLADG
ncbi:hypothetical protein BSLG_000712 [Batrachochytrium salamandrivorans]|nr:hypothetical protein BSLG_000712 [Batrachochytrium salamandrivorans]